MIITTTISSSSNNNNTRTESGRPTVLVTNRFHQSGPFRLYQWKENPVFSALSRSHLLPLRFSGAGTRPSVWIALTLFLNAIIT